MFSCAQPGQTGASDVPQPLQKRESGGFSFWQAGQFMGRSTKDLPPIAGLTKEPRCGTEKPRAGSLIAINDT
jgi:hypothetical protein